MYSLVVLNGRAAGSAVRLDPAAEKVAIGRSPSGDLSIPDQRVSRLHAALWCDDGRWHLEDCQSLNGTLVNAQRVAHAVLAPGDVIRIADNLILFARDSEESEDRAGMATGTPTAEITPAASAGREVADVIAHQANAALEDVEHRERLERANRELRRHEADKRLVGSSSAMREVLERIARVGSTTSTVVILGESGSGKELVAQSIHRLSPRGDGPYLPVNCAAFSESLLESTLFGHEPGAFTGANRRFVGHLERAHRGTLFLDEVSELSAACQSKLLRVLEGHPFHRVGGQEWVRVDVRIIAATNRDLRDLVRAGRFREDLYYRLRVIEIRLPPLRERGDDAMELAALFLDDFRRQTGRKPLRFSTAAIDRIRRYAWPGNVRELKNAIERAVVLSRGEELSPEDLALPAEEPAASPAPSAISLKEAERRHIERVIDQAGGNKTLASRMLGIGRGTLYKKLDSRDV